MLQHVALALWLDIEPLNQRYVFGTGFKSLCYLRLSTDLRRNAAVRGSRKIHFEINNLGSKYPLRRTADRNLSGEITKPIIVVVSWGRAYTPWPNLTDAKVNNLLYMIFTTVVIIIMSMRINFYINLISYNNIRPTKKFIFRTKMTKKSLQAGHFSIIDDFDRGWFERFGWSSWMSLARKKLKIMII